MLLPNPSPMRTMPTCKVVNLSNRSPTVLLRSGLRGPSATSPFVSVFDSDIKKRGGIFHDRKFWARFQVSPRIHDTMKAVGAVAV